MELITLIVRLTVAGVFLVAGVAKLADLPGSRQALAGFGLPESLAAPFGLLLPLAEIAVALALLPATSAWWGGLAALGLLALFIVGIAVTMARGRAPDCHCFGQLSSRPIGWPTLARNGVLAALAALIVWQGPAGVGPSALAWAGAAGSFGAVALAIGAILLALVLGEGWVLLQVLRQNGRLLLRVEALEAHLGLETPDAEPEAPQGLPAGTPAPAFQLPSLSGAPVTLDGLRAAGRPVLLLFSDPGCGPCNSLLPDVARWQQQHAGRLTIAMLSRGAAEINRAKSSEHGLTTVLLQPDQAVSAAYQADVTPSAVLVAPDGTIAAPIARGADAVRSLVAQATRPADPLRAGLTGRPVIPLVGAPAPRPEPGTLVGTPAPEVRLPALDGGHFDLGTLRGSEALLLFWNPQCGFCQRMLGDLKTWEAEAPRGAPRIVVVSTGGPEANRAMGLRSPVLLDDGFTTGRAFGASGTPSAVLVDGEGRVASPVVVGAAAVLDIARERARTRQETVLNERVQR